MLTKHKRILIHLENKGEVGAVKMLSPPVMFLLCDSFMPFVFRVCLYHTVLSVPCRLEVTCWERTDFLARLCMIFTGVLSLFMVSWVLWYCIVLIPEFCLFPYFLTFGVLLYCKQ